MRGQAAPDFPRLVRLTALSHKTLRLFQRGVAPIPVGIVARDAGCGSAPRR